jgi:hypothetical protein
MEREGGEREREAREEIKREGEREGERERERERGLVPCQATRSRMHALR